MSNVPDFKLYDKPADDLRCVAHQDRNIGTAPAQIDVARYRFSKAMVDWIQDWISVIGPAFGNHHVDRAVKRGHVSRAGRNQDRHGGTFVNDADRLFVEAQQKVRASARRARELIGVEGVDAKLSCLQHEAP